MALNSVEQELQVLMGEYTGLDDFYLQLNIFKVHLTPILSSLW